MEYKTNPISLLEDFKKMRIKCPKCGHKWVCKSKLIYTTCPSCQRKMKIPNSNKK